MSSLHGGFRDAKPAISLHVPRERELSRRADQPRRGVSLMRRYEVAALLPDLSLSFKTHVAPATPLFEDTSSALARGTLIPTSRGPVAIEDLIPGDLVETAAGTKPIQWIGSTTFVPGRDDDNTQLTALTRITADAFGMGRPAMDLLVGPAARRVVRHARLERLLGQEAVLAPVSDYIDGDRFLEVTPGGTVQLYHLMMAGHTTITIDGIELETYHPGKSLAQIGGENTRALFLSMFPDKARIEDFGPLRLARTSREVIDSLLDT